MNPMIIEILLKLTKAVDLLTRGGAGDDAKAHAQVRKVFNLIDTARKPTVPAPDSRDAEIRKITAQRDYAIIDRRVVEDIVTEAIDSAIRGDAEMPNRVGDWPIGQEVFNRINDNLAPARAEITRLREQVAAGGGK